MTTKRLPAGWRWVQLDYLASPEKYSIKRGPFGSSLRKELFVSAGYKVYEQQHAIANDFNIGNYYITPELYEELIAFRVQPQDIIISCSGTIGRVGIVPPDAEPGIINQALLKITLNQDVIIPAYFKLMFESELTQKQLEALSYGSGLKNVASVSSLKQIDFLLPPIGQQREIVTLYQQQMQYVAQARAAAQVQLEAAQALPAAYLRAVFNSPEAKKWSRYPLGEMCVIEAPLVDPKLPEYGVLPHVSGENIESDTGCLRNIHSAAEDGMISGKYLFDPGDVLYSKLRPYLRKVALAPFEGLCSADMYPIKVNREVLDPAFTVWMLLSDEFTNYANEESRRARMPKLNRKQLFSWYAPLPPLDHQIQLAEYLTNQIGHSKQTVQMLTSQLETIDNLPAAYLRQAFNGEL